MNIARKTQTKETKAGDTMTVFEYPIMDNALHGAVVEFKGRYPEKRRVVNEKCYEVGYVIKGSGKLIIEGNEIEFSEGDQLLIKPGQRYNTHGHKLRFPHSKKAQFVTECGILLESQCYNVYALCSSLVSRATQRSRIINV